MLHSLICCNEDGYVLLARYFDASMPIDARKRYETQLAQICQNQMPQLWDQAKKEQHDQLALCEDQYVVLRQMGELRWMLSGAHEYDELVLMDLMNVWNAVITTQLEKKLTEASLLANYAKVVVALDELVQHGHAENTDEGGIEQMSKLRPYPTK